MNVPRPTDVILGRLFVSVVHNRYMANMRKYRDSARFG
jgi:hypothetical protein